MHIEPTTLHFLSDLAQNNNKPWFDENRDRYQLARKNFMQFIDHLIEGLSEFDPGIGVLEAKHCIFRINRDIRFSKNKDPYKSNFGANISRGGRKSRYSGFYIHLEAGQCFLAGGAYAPMPENLQKIRQRIDLQANELREIINKDRFKSLFGELKGDKLKTAPKGFPKDHPDIDLLRYKGMYVSHACGDEKILSDGFLSYALSVFEEMVPMNDFFNDAIGADD